MTKSKEQEKINNQWRLMQDLIQEKATPDVYFTDQMKKDRLEAKMSYLSLIFGKHQNLYKGAHEYHDELLSSAEQAALGKDISALQQIRLTCHAQSFDVNNDSKHCFDFYRDPYPSECREVAFFLERFLKVVADMDLEKRMNPILDSCIQVARHILRFDVGSENLFKVLTGIELMNARFNMFR